MLGEGGMGQVYLAEQIKMRRLCALKVMHTEQMHDADAAGRFGREAYNASRIMHPNVAAIYDFGETEDGRLYIAMEYVDGAPLSDLLRREQRLPIDRSIDIGIQVAEALAAAHELNIVHRDLKPDNVMLATGKGGRDVVKVVDFGIAKAVQTDGQQITRTGFIVGTPAYMSPEQISGDPLDGRSDIYALGCILFKMLTGTEPLGGPGQAVLMRRLTEPPPRPRSLNPSIPPALDDVVVRALARMAQDRFDSAEAFAQALRAASTAPREVSRGGAIWSALRARFLSWARPRPIAVVGPPPLAEPADAIVATPHSPALARPRVQWAGGAVTPQPGPSQSQTPAGTVAAAGAPAVAVAGAQPSPPVPWRIHVDPAAITPGPVDAAFPTTPQDQRRPTRGLAIPVTVAATGIVIAIALAVRHPDSPTKNARVQEPMAVPPPSASVTERDRPQGPSAIPGAVGDTVGGPRQTNVSRGSNAIAPTVTLRDFQAAELAALHTRDLAAQVGATPRELAHGDSLRLRAEGLAESGQYAGASGLATRADQAWAGAHRVAEERIKAVAPTTVTPTLGGETPKSTPPAGTTASRSSDTAAAPDARPPRPAGAPFTASTDTTTVAAAGAGDVRKVVTAYIAAVNTRQMAEMRRIWPTMPDDAAHNWQALFNAATDLSVKLVSADDPAVNGSHAQTDFAYSITGYVPSQGAIPSSTLHFRAKLERDAWGWRIVSMDRRK